MKNYYETLEVDMKASKEIIDKAFKVLAKKYHPDTQEESKKDWAESKFKEINEAYEVLSNIDKKKEYDINLEDDKNNAYLQLSTQNEELKALVIDLQNELNNVQNSDNTLNQNQNFSNGTYQNDAVYYTTSEPNAQYYEPIQHKSKLKDFLAFLITISLLLFIGFILWNIPFSKKYLISFYENNAIIRGLIDFIINIFHF